LVCSSWRIFTAGTCATRLPKIIIALTRRVAKI
jgi:hypothetical protein